MPTIILTPNTDDNVPDADDNVPDTDNNVLDTHNDADECAAVPGPLMPYLH